MASGDAIAYASMGALIIDFEVTAKSVKPVVFHFAPPKMLSGNIHGIVKNIFTIIQVVNIIMPLWHRRKQSVTDLFASTLLVKTKREINGST